jgi:DNA polymerase III subunit epsilon
MEPLLSEDLLTHYRQMSQGLFTVVDVETTGHKPPENRVIEVSVLQATLADGVLQQQTDLINPGIPVPENITQFTGISTQMVATAPLAEQIWPRYVPWLQQGCFTAHNLQFDYGFIQAELQLSAIEFARPSCNQFCTVILSRLMLPELPSRSLPYLVKHFQFDVGVSHRAAADTQACWLLAQRLLLELQDSDDEALLKRFGRQWLPLGDVALIFGTTGRQARSLLEKARLTPRFVGKGKTPLYRRSEVERVWWERQNQQLSLL